MCRIRFELALRDDLDVVALFAAGATRAVGQRRVVGHIGDRVRCLGPGHDPRLRLWVGCCVSSILFRRHFANLKNKFKKVASISLLKNIAQTGLFLFSFFSQYNDRYSTKFNYNGNSIDGVHGIRTPDRRMVETDESTDIWRPPTSLFAANFLEKVSTISDLPKVQIELNLNFETKLKFNVKILSHQIVAVTPIEIKVFDVSLFFFLNVLCCFLICAFLTLSMDVS